MLRTVSTGFIGCTECVYAIDVMQKYGLKMNQVPPAAEASWEDLLHKTFAGLVGRSYDKTSLHSG